LQNVLQKDPRPWASEARSDSATLLVAGHDKRGAKLSAKQTARSRQTRGICLEIFIISVAVNVEGTVYNNMHELIGIFSEWQ